MIKLYSIKNSKIMYKVWFTSYSFYTIHKINDLLIDECTILFVVKLDLRKISSHPGNETTKQPQLAACMHACMGDITILITFINPGRDTQKFICGIISLPLAPLLKYITKDPIMKYPVTPTTSLYGVPHDMIMAYMCAGLSFYILTI